MFQSTCTGLALAAGAVVAVGGAIQVAGAQAARPTSRGAHAPASARDTPRADTGRRVAAFDSAWRTVGTSLTARGVTGVDWARVAAELRPLAERAATDDELRTVIRRMLARVGESHFTLIPGAVPPAADGPPGSAGPTQGASAASADVGGTLGSAGIEVRVVDERLLVWRVAARGAADRAGIRPGWEIEAVDGAGWRPPPVGGAKSGDERTLRMRRLQSAVAAAAALRGPPGSVVKLTMRDTRGASITRALARDSAEGPVVRLGNLPPLIAPLTATRLALQGGDCVAVIRFPYWMPAIMGPFDRAMDEARRCRAIVLDLRGNVGGVAGMVMGVAGYFLDAPHPLGTLRAHGTELRYVANPRGANDAGRPIDPYAGPLAILIDELSVSTSEIFAVAMQSLGRARVFGERSTGQALPAMVTRLPNGDALMHVVADFVAPDGTRIEGRGAVPDVFVPLRRDDLVAGHDAPLAAAVAWIASAAPRP